MFEITRAGIAEWNQRTSERQKLQQSYIVLLVTDILLAGVVSLFNESRSEQLLFIALALITTFVTNLLVWALLQTFVIAKLPKQPTTRRATRAKR